MILTIGQLAAFIGCGLAWRFFKPMQLEAASLRRSLTGLLYYIILPLLVFSSLYNTPLNTRSLMIVVSALLTSVATIGVTWAWLRLHSNWSAKLKATLMLAALFGNVAFAGYPVATNIYGDWSGRIVMLYFVSGILPLLFLLGFLHTRELIDLPETMRPKQFLLRFPILWAVVAGVACSYLQIELPAFVFDWINLMVAGATPLMLIAIGLSLRWSPKWNGITKKLLPVVAIQLIAAPLLMWLGLNFVIDITGPKTNMLLLLMAGMPVAVMGLDLCERFGLEVAVYQIILTISTVLSLVSLPLIYHML